MDRLDCGVACTMRVAIAVVVRLRRDLRGEAILTADLRRCAEALC